MLLYMERLPRKKFDCHVFANYCGHVFDACVGPQKGNLIQSSYFTKVIDVSTEKTRSESIFQNETGTLKNRSVNLLCDDYAIQ